MSTTTTREEVVEQAAEAIVAYEVWHAQQKQEFREGEGSEKYVKRGNTVYTARTAEQIINDFLGEAPSDEWSALASEANQRAKELRDL